MRTTLCCLALMGLLFASGCSPADPVALGKEFAAAIKAGDFNRLDGLRRQIDRLPESDREQFMQAYFKEMMGGFGGDMPFGNMGGMNPNGMAGFDKGMGDMLKGMGDMMKNMPKLDFPKFDMPKFEQPKFEFPKFEQPKFEFPK